MNPCAPRTVNALTQELRAELEERHGPVIGGAELYRCLGLRSSAALRQARRRGQVAVSLFTLPKRRGYFALSREVADWIAEARFASSPCSAPEKGGVG